MSLFRRIFYFFSSYTDAEERSVGLFFSGLTEHSSQSHTKLQINELLQKNIAVINLWSEYRYKGYKYLRKSQRKKLYENLQIIAEDFEKYRIANIRPADQVTAHLKQLAPYSSISDDRALLFQALTEYFSPARGVYEYHESSSFGRLLRNPSSEKLIGDCNQIVTLYIYLYSRYFPISDLQLRLLPGHVALHYEGIDIETTNGTFTNYSNKKDAVLMPIEEIVSVNLLDTTDSYLSTHEVAAEDFLQASRFAYILSHDRDIVTRNLDAAYASLINSLMKRHNFAQALKFARASRNIELIGIVGHNGAVHNIQHNNFATARRFAEHAPKRDQLIRDSYRAEGVHYFDAHNYQAAIKAFKHYGDDSLVRKCYEALFFEEQNKLGKNMTTDSIKKYASTIKHMETYAKKSGNKQLVDHAKSLREHL